jgi:hypothetical protein
MIEREIVTCLKALVRYVLDVALGGDAAPRRMTGWFEAV